MLICLAVARGEESAAGSRKSRDYLLHHVLSAMKGIKTISHVDGCTQITILVFLVEPSLSL